MNFWPPRTLIGHGWSSDDPRRVIEAAGLGHQIVCSDRVARTPTEPSLQTLAGHLLQVRGKVLPVRPLLLLGVVVDRPAVIETVRHVIPVGGNHRVFYFRKMIQQLEIETAAGANLVLVQHVEHAPEADTDAVVHARVERNIRLCRAAFGQVLEELHVRRDPECETRIVRPFDDRAINDGRIVEAPGCESHAVLYPPEFDDKSCDAYPACVLNQSMISAPVPFHTP